ncbi:hypothetical protein ACHAXT_001856 [Thalassiosira profunda]
MKRQAKIGAVDGAAVGSAVSLGVGVWREGHVEIINPTPIVTPPEVEQNNLMCPYPTKPHDNERPVKRRGLKAPSSSVKIGDEAPDFELEDRMGINHKLSSYRGRKVLLSFFRFAACPTTMLRMDLMERHYDMLKRGGITVICVFNSLPDMINNFASETSAVVALSDRDKKAYKQYRVKESTKAYFQYEAEVYRNPQRYKPFTKSWQLLKKDMFLGGVRVLPADFLIDEAGVVVDLFRAQDPWKDHIPLERLEAFIPEARRCKCNKSDCWTVQCRENHALQKDDLRHRRTAVVGPAIAQ